jgi:hypothetical protein
MSSMLLHVTPISFFLFPHANKGTSYEQQYVIVCILLTSTFLGLNVIFNTLFSELSIYVNAFIREAMFRTHRSVNDLD